MKIFLAIAAGLATAIILFALYRRWTYTPMSTAMIGRTLVITAARDALIFGPRRHDFLVALGTFQGVLT